jgi:hypothetical protein
MNQGFKGLARRRLRQGRVVQETGLVVREENSGEQKTTGRTEAGVSAAMGGEGRGREGKEGGG